jgi:hypothetical protein
MPTHLAHAQAIGNTESVELGNTLGTDEPAPLKPEPAAAQATVAPVLATAEGEPAKDARELHRDRLLQAPEEMPVATSAASRRYRKMDLSAYRELMQSSASVPVLSSSPAASH